MDARAHSEQMTGQRTTASLPLEVPVYVPQALIITRDRILDVRVE
jgi:hypothetical protein